MMEIFQIHPDNPQIRFIKNVDEILTKGGIIIYPTDTAYALGCKLGNKQGLDRIRKIRRLDSKHHFTLMCKDLANIAQYARVSNRVFRLLKANTPGPFTFILPASPQVPRRLQHPSQKTIGLRIPGNPIAQALAAIEGEAIFTTTLQLPQEDLPRCDPENIIAHFSSQVDAIIDAGFGGVDVSTIVDCRGDHPEIIRQGKGVIR